MSAGVRIQVLRLRGELNLEDVLKLRTLLDDYLRAGMVRVVLNLSEVSHVHLVGLPVLSARVPRFREYGGDLKLVGLSEYLRHIFTLAGAETLFDYCETEELAAQRFAQMT